MIFLRVSVLGNFCVHSYSSNIYSGFSNNDIHIYSKLEYAFIKQLIEIKDTVYSHE